jgi:Tfp pilus assembly protein PilX
MRTYPSIAQRSVKNRNAYLYVAVLFVATIVGMIGLSAISVARLQLRTTTETTQATNAGQLAQSAIEHALSTIQADANWRSTYSNDVIYPTPRVVMNDGDFAWKLVDVDGSLSDDDSDSVTVVGIGRVGEFSSARSVVLYPSGQGIDSLGKAFHCNQDVVLKANVDFETDQTISSNGDIDATKSNSEIQGDASASGTISGTVTGSSSPGAATLRMPGSDVFDYYKARGTQIDYELLPGSSGDRKIERVLLSPNNNPFGETNAAGIYVIDCGQQKLKIKDSRILGTLVLLNCPSSSRVEGHVRWDHFVTNQPALLVDGDIEFRFKDDDLEESKKNTNFNPVGSAYAGIEDSDMTDEYPSSIVGLVYVSGTLDISGSSIKTVDGVVLCNAVVADADSIFDYDATYLITPPPGFGFGNPMQIIPGSWQLESLAP